MNREALCAFILGDFTLKAQLRCSGHSLGENAGCLIPARTPEKLQVCEF